jgi:hypothetical protein
MVREKAEIAEMEWRSGGAPGGEPLLTIAGPIGRSREKSCRYPTSCSRRLPITSLGVDYPEDVLSVDQTENAKRGGNVRSRSREPLAKASSLPANATSQRHGFNYGRAKAAPLQGLGELSRYFFISPLRRTSALHGCRRFSRTRTRVLVIRPPRQLVALWFDEGVPERVPAKVAWARHWR